MTSPSVSIIINNYNYAPYLAAAIDSALVQTYPGVVEVIVVDDGSTDNSRQVLERFEGKVKLILRSNGGQAAAFNSGFGMSTGRLVAFLDSDDELMPDAMETVVNQWRDDYAKVQFPLEILDPEGHPTGLRTPRVPVAGGDVMPTLLKTGRYVSAPTSGNVFNRRFLEAVMPIPEVEWAKTADGYLNNCAPFFGTIGSHSRPLGYYRIHGQSMSSVISHGKLNLKTAEQLLLNGLREKALIEQFARAKCFKTHPRIVVSHWMFLKLKLTVEKLSARARGTAFVSKSVIRAGSQMIASVFTSPELKITKKMQYIAWALGVALLPRPLSQRVVRFGFEPAPSAKLANTLRRW